MIKKMIFSLLFSLFLGLPLVVKAQGNPPPRESRDDERARLPELIEAEKWEQIGTATESGGFAPSLVALHEGGYRIFVNSFEQGGIVSASSPDGLNFTPDEGVRLVNGGEGQPDCIASHPWVIALEDGYRMYYQGDATCRQGGDVSGIEPEFRILSAFSFDGITFEREGVRIDIGDSTGLFQAAHGRVITLEDGTYRMFFSANRIGVQGPASVLGASSEDGLTWTLDEDFILIGGHDPTVILLDGTFYIYTTFLRDNFVVLSSNDGYSFTPLRWVEFYDQTGQRLEEFGDADILLTADGQVLMYGTGKGSKGVGIFHAE